MVLSEGQVQVRDLVMGAGTVYSMQSDFNPWIRQVRADQSGPRAWTHGTWSGAEWADQAVIPMRVLILAEDQAGWLAAHQQLAAAFRPASADVEMRFVVGDTEYLMYVRPRLVEPETQTIGTGVAYTRCAAVALDSLIYAGQESSVPLGLPTYSGGLTVPFAVPVTIDATQNGGVASVTNAGTADVGLTIRIDGPAPQPSITLTLSDGTAQTLYLDIDVAAGQWLDIDTKTRTVLLNGSANRRGSASGDWPLLPQGTHTLRWRAADYSVDALLTARWRSAWW